MLSAAFKQRGRSHRHRPFKCIGGTGGRAIAWADAVFDWQTGFPISFTSLLSFLIFTFLSARCEPPYCPWRKPWQWYYRSGLYLNSIKGPLQHKHDESLWLFLITSIQHADYPPAHASLQAGLSGCATVPLSRGHRKRGASTWVWWECAGWTWGVSMACQPLDSCSHHHRQEAREYQKISK